MCNSAMEPDEIKNETEDEAVASFFVRGHPYLLESSGEEGSAEEYVARMTAFTSG